MEEGTGHQLKDRPFVLNVGKTAQFRFFQSSDRTEDTAGTLIEEIESLEELSPVEVPLSSEVSESVQVTLESLVTETGMLELWFVSRDGRRWKLEFNVRPKRPRS
jgi:hypothetical protein